jgi:hypothetical protein
VASDQQYEPTDEIIQDIEATEQGPSFTAMQPLKQHRRQQAGSWTRSKRQHMLVGYVLSCLN